MKVVQRGTLKLWRVCWGSVTEKVLVKERRVHLRGASALCGGVDDGVAVGVGKAEDVSGEYGGARSPFEAAVIPALM